MKNLLDRFKGRCEWAEEKISKFEDKTMEIIELRNGKKKD